MGPIHLVIFFGAVGFLARIGECMVMQSNNEDSDAYNEDEEEYYAQLRERVVEKSLEYMRDAMANGYMLKESKDPVKWRVKKCVKSFDSKQLETVASAPHKLAEFTWLQIGTHGIYHWSREFYYIHLFKYLVPGSLVQTIMGFENFPLYDDTIKQEQIDAVINIGKIICGYEEDSPPGPLDESSTRERISSTVIKDFFGALVNNSYTRGLLSDEWLNYLKKKNGLSYWDDAAAKILDAKLTTNEWPCMPDADQWEMKNELQMLTQQLVTGLFVCLSDIYGSAPSDPYAGAWLNKPADAKGRGAAAPNCFFC